MKMYKKFKLELVGTGISYLKDKVMVNASFKMIDPDKELGDGEYQSYGQYSTTVEFDKDSEPTKADILEAVNNQEGIVSTY